MEIKHIKGLLDYYQFTRMTGHSILAAKIAKESGGRLVCANSNQLRDFEKGAPILISTRRDLQFQRIPIVLDNYTIVKILETSVQLHDKNNNLTNSIVAMFGELKDNVTDNRRLRAENSRLENEIKDLSLQIPPSESVKVVQFPLVDDKGHEVIDKLNRIGITVLETFAEYHVVYLKKNMGLQFQSTNFRSLWIEGKIVATIHYGDSFFIKFNNQQ